MSIGIWQIVLILVIVMILFGAGKLPQVFESFGKGLKSFRDAQRDEPTGSVDVTPKLSESTVADAEEVKDKARG